MTPFARLETLEKVAMVTPPPSGYTLPTNPNSGLKDPNGALVSTTPAPAEQGMGSMIASGVADVALGSNPFTGVPWFGGKAINDFYHGRWGSGLANVGFGALSFLPGAGSVAKGAVTAGKVGLAARGAAAARSAMAPATALMARTGLQTGAKLSQPVRSGLAWGGGTAAGVGIGADVTGFGGGQPAAAPENPNAYKTPTTNAGNLQQFMTSAVVNNGKPPVPQPVVP